MKTTPAIRKVLGAISVALFLSSCVTYKSINHSDITNNQSRNSTLLRGDVAKIIMKSGEMIEKMKVKEIDSLRISGIQVKETPARWIKVNRTLMINDVKEIRKRKVSAGKTAGAVVLSVSVPLLIVATVSGGFAWGHP